MSLCHARVTLAGNMKQDRCGNWTSERWQDLSEITHLERVGVTFARNIPFVLRQGSKTLSSGPQVKAELWPRGSEGEALAALVVVVDSCPEDTPSFKITIVGSQLVGLAQLVKVKQELLDKWIVSSTQCFASWETIWTWKLPEQGCAGLFQRLTAHAGLSGLPRWCIGRGPTRELFQQD